MLKFNLQKTRVFVLIVLLSYQPLSGIAQYENNYTPTTYSSPASHELIRSIKSANYEDLDDIKPLTKKMEMKSIFQSITKSLVRQVDKNKIIEDAFFQNYIENITNTILDNNKLSNRTRRILISRDIRPNAACLGEGTFTITLGILSKSLNESQIAFTIAHELAHYELKHVVEKVEREVVHRTSRKVKKGITNIVTKNGSDSEDVEELKDIVYTESRYNRSMEMQADSLAFVYLKNTNYNLEDAYSELDVLEAAFLPKYELGEEWFDAFNFSRYPFQDYWLRPRLSVYSQKPESIFFFDADSLLSHPEISARKNALEPLLEITHKPSNIQSLKLFNSISTRADFECVEAAYFLKQYDISLYYCLQLLSIYPNNSYLTSRIGLILLQLHEAKDYGTFKKFVPGYTAYYSPQLKMVNNFLYNLSQKELGELAYLFMNKVPHFNSDVEIHYFLLWKACIATDRTEVKEKIEAAYKDKFDRKISFYPDPFIKERPKKNAYKMFQN